MLKNLGIALIIVALSTACSNEPPPSSGATAPDDVEQATPWSKPMLPVFETAAEKRVGKADWYDDYRNSHLDIYGITEAPGVTVRPMAEWEPAEALIITYSSSTLPSGIKNSFVDIIAAAKDVVDVHVVYDSSQAYNSLAGLMAQSGISTSSVTWVNMANDSIWSRDFGPMSIFSGAKVGNVDPRYYHQRYNDDAIPTLLVGDQMGLTTYRVPLDMEGGNFMSDTNGTCAASQGLYWYNGTSQSNVNSYMEDYLGCQELIVVQPMDGEGTTHIDMQAKFMTDDTVVVGEYTWAQDSTNKQILDANAAQLASAGFNVERIPMPDNTGGVFRSYTNSLLVNGVHIVPVYSGYSSMQAEALAVYQSILPSWQHVTSDSDAIIQWSGAIHCITKLVAAGQWTPLEADPELICDTYDCYPGGGTTGCGDVTYEGCCEGDLLKYCEGNQINQQMCNPGTCGWDSSNQFYSCGTGGGSDPSGQHPKDCDGGCTPDCAGKECGSDGCGGSCGTCAGDEICSQTGLCVPDDECGDVTYAGYCDGNTLVWCEDGKLYSADCALYGDYVCQWVPENEGSYCVYQPPCEPDCGGKECGSDGCGGSCGSCAAGLTCQDGVCTEGPCEPDCTGKQCGPDGCGGSCGACAAGLTCQDGVCTEEPCKPDCTGKQCGPDGCGGSCGACAEGLTCQGGTCTDQCTPDCVGRACGPDGCGGSCGDCPKDWSCDEDAGACVKDPADDCGNIPSTGTCMPGQILAVCVSNQVVETDCTLTGELCSWVQEEGIYSCVAPCTPDCDGRECGSDGCDGLCGDCPDGQSCAAGACVDPGDEDVTGGEDAGVEVLTGASSSGCAVSARPAAGAWLLLALMLGLFAALRVRQES